MNWREVIDDEQHRYAQVAAYLQGGGVPSVDDAIRELRLQPVHGPFKELANAGMFNWFYTERVREANAILKRAVGDEVEEKATRLFKAINQLNGSAAAEADLARSVRVDLEAVMQLLVLPDRKRPCADRAQISSGDQVSANQSRRADRRSRAQE